MQLVAMLNLLTGRYIVIIHAHDSVICSFNSLISAFESLHQSIVIYQAVAAKLLCEDSR